MQRILLILGAGLMALAVWLVAGSESDQDPAGRPELAADAVPVRLHLNGTPVATVEPEEVLGRDPIVERLPPDARDPEAWTLLAVAGEAGRRMSIANPATRFGEQTACLYLLEGHLALGMFGSAAREPSTYIARVTDVIVWTEAPAPDPIRLTTADLEIVVDGGPPVRPTPDDLSGLAVAMPAGDGGHPGWPLRAVVALAVDPGRVTAVQVQVGDETDAQASGDLLRSDGAALLLRPNRRGLLAFDGSGVDAAGLPVDLRVRGVTRLAVTTGGAGGTAPAQGDPAIEPSLAEREAARKALAAQREAVRAVAARYPDADAREALVAYLEHEHPRVRGDAVQSLKRWRDASEVLFAHLDREQDDHVRGIVFGALSRIAPAEYMEKLVPYVGAAKNALNKDAAKAIKRIHRRTGEPMPEGLPDWATRMGRRRR